MKIHKIYLFVILLSTYTLFTQAQTENCKPELFPRDTSFTTHSAYIKESKTRPYIKIAEEKITNDITYLGTFAYSKPYKGRNLQTKVFRPSDKNKYPALILVHGGGWSSGNLTMEEPTAIRIAKHGYVTIPVEYRLSHEAPYPMAVYDLKTAVRWLKENADILGVDTTHIAISGCSAGGQLAGLIGVTNNQPEYESKIEYANHSSNVQAVINIDGTSDFTTLNSVSAAQTKFEAGKFNASTFWLGGTYEQAKNTWIAASPIFQVTKDSAPVCFINSSIERFHDGRDEIIEKLNTWNIYTEVHSFDDTPHPFWLFDPWFKPTTEYMISFLDKMFKGGN